MSADDQVERLWNEHMAAAFPPRLRENGVAGVEVVLLDADIAGHVDDWLRSGKRPDAARSSALRRLIAEAEAVTPHVLGQVERDDICRLRRMARLVLTGRR